MVSGDLCVQYDRHLIALFERGNENRQRDHTGCGLPPMASVLASCGDREPARMVAANSNPAGAADTVAAVNRDWPRALRHVGKLAASNPIAAWTLARDAQVVNRRPLAWLVLGLRRGAIDQLGPSDT